MTSTPERHSGASIIIYINRRHRTNQLQHPSSSLRQPTNRQYRHNTNTRRQQPALPLILLVLRDNNPAIACPNTWDLPGGHIEPNETPRACIIREIHEELEIDVTDCTLMRHYECSDRTEHIFTMAKKNAAQKPVLHEGQMLRWFSPARINHLALASDIGTIIADFTTAYRIDSR